MKCKNCGFNYSSLHAGLCRQCKRFNETFPQEKDMKNKGLLELKKLKNSTLLKELERRIKLKEIRFNYDGRQIGEDIGGLISWDATDKYDLDFAELEEYLEKKEKKNHE